MSLIVRFVSFLISLYRQAQSPFDRVVCICDYSDMARLEIELGLRQVVPQWVQIHFLPVRNFSTVEAGFALAQLALTIGNARTLFFVNVAPRKDNAQRRTDNNGEPFVFGRLRNGSLVLSTIGGHCLSWVRDSFEVIHRVKNGEKRSQFRSRDWLLPVVGQLVAKNYSFRGEQLSITDLPELPGGVVAAYLDNYGNIKTNLRQSHLRTLCGYREGRVRVRIGVLKSATDCAAEISALAGAGIFDVLEGEAVLAPGSSTHGIDYDPFVEIVLRSGSAAEALAIADGTRQIAVTPGARLLLEFERPQQIPASVTTSATGRSTTNGASAIGSSNGSAASVAAPHS